jgi:hypothetical protein
MHAESREPRAGGGPRLERAIVLQLLRDDHEESWGREELLAELGGEPAALEEALGRLQGRGVITLSTGQVAASDAVRALNDLDLIGI